eukprot:scaffold249477_cov37-Tisochrysis_lutea.AAC.1
MARTTDSLGTGAHHPRSPSSGAVETSETTVCEGLNCRARQVSSVMVGSTPMKTISDPSSTAWLSLATVTSCGNSAASAAAFCAFLGETTMALGGCSSVARPRTMALDMVPVPTKPMLFPLAIGRGEGGGVGDAPRSRPTSSPPRNIQ